MTPFTDMRKLLSMAIFAITLPGCLAIPLTDRALSTEEIRKKRLEDYWNSWVGKHLPVEKLFDGVILAKTVTENSTSFLLTQHYNSCRITLVTSNNDSTLQSWNYGSDPIECWRYVPSAP